MSDGKDKTNPVPENGAVSPPEFVFMNRREVPITYANFLNIVHSDGEFFLEFALADIPAIQEDARKGSKVIPIEIKARIAIPSNHFDGMVQMIQMNHMLFMKEQSEKYSAKVNAHRATGKKDDGHDPV